MTLLTLVVAICVLLFALWLARQLPAPWQAPILVVIVLVALFVIANTFAPGLLHTRIG